LEIEVVPSERRPTKNEEKVFLFSVIMALMAFAFVARMEQVQKYSNEDHSKSPEEPANERLPPLLDGDYLGNQANTALKEEKEDKRLYEMSLPGFDTHSRHFFNFDFKDAE
jgi:hypothetical protein